MRDDTRPDFVDLLRRVPTPLLVLDRSHHIVFANRGAEATFGYDSGALVGMLLDAVVPEGIPQAGEDQCLAGPPTTVAARRKDGEELVLEWTTGEQDTPSGYVIVAVRDISVSTREETSRQTRARQQAQVAELGRRALTGIGLDELMTEAAHLVAQVLDVEFAHLLELRPDGIAVYRAGVGWHDGMIGGTTVELAAGTAAERVVLEQVPVLIEDLHTDPRFETTASFREHGIVSSLTVPLYGAARPLGILGVHTARRRPFPEAEIDFVQSVANVVATAIERHRDDEQLRERQLVRAEQMAAMGQVAAGVAHELRNPLTSIKGLVQVNLREAVARGLPAEDLRVIEHEIRRMERTLQTFLDFTRPPRPNRRRLDLTEVVERVVALVGGRARKQSVSLRVTHPDVPATVDGDEDQLQQLVLNLILNALDAMPHGGAIEVELRPPRNGPLELLIRDSGPGVAPHILPKVFETFVSSKETGIGLGLPVSKRIAEDHGGSLTAYNLPAGGACFAFRLPAAGP